MGFVRAIRKPSGHIMTYKPLIKHCAVSDVLTLDKEKTATYESAYIGYGKDGFYFDAVGYRFDLIGYYSIGGSLVTSNVLNVRVRSPTSSADEEVSDIFLGDQVGTLLYLAYGASL